MEKPILSIRIPTYNRPEQIQMQVRRLLPQLCDEVILEVFDNCSPQKVEELFSEEEKKLFLITRHSTNIGGDANIARCFENCLTPWLWTLSDDDYVMDNAIKKALNYITCNKDCVFINCLSHNQGKTYNFAEFAKKLSDASMFGSSFAMSTCFYNIKLLSKDLILYYRYLSSMLGTLLMVAKNVQRTGNKCFFVRDIFVELCDDVGWNYGTYIYFSSLFVYAFKKGDKRINIRKTLLLGYFELNYYLIEQNRKSSYIGYIQRIQLFIKATKLQGLFNSLYYCPQRWARALLFVLLGQTVTEKIRKIKHKIENCK